MANEANFTDIEIYANGLSCSTSLTIPPGSVGDTQISYSTANRIDDTKVKQQVVCTLAIDDTTTITGDHYQLFVAPSAGTVLEVYARTQVSPTGGDLDYAFDISKAADGSSGYSSILAATVAAANTDYTAMTEPTINTATFSAGDSFRVEMTTTGTTGTQGKGVIICVVFEI